MYIYGLSAEVHVKLSDILLSKSGGCGLGHLWNDVVAYHNVVILSFYLDGQRVCQVYCIMLGGVLNKQLYGTWWNESGHRLVRYVNDYLESFGEPDSEEVYVLVYKDYLIAERHEFLFFAFDHITVDTGQLVSVCAGFFRLVFANEAVKDVQGVEKEMGIYLTFQLQVSVLCHICLFSLMMHLISCSHGIVHDIYDAVNSDLSHQGYDEQSREVMNEVFIDVERQTETDKDCLQKGTQQHE